MAASTSTGQRRDKTRIRAKTGFLYAFATLLRCSDQSQTSASPTRPGPGLGLLVVCSLSRAGAGPCAGRAGAVAWRQRGVVGVEAGGDQGQGGGDWISGVTETRRRAEGGKCHTDACICGPSKARSRAGAWRVAGLWAEVYVVWAWGEWGDPGPRPTPSA